MHIIFVYNSKRALSTWNKVLNRGGLIQILNADIKTLSYVSAKAFKITLRGVLVKQYRRTSSYIYRYTSYKFVYQVKFTVSGCQE